jgi:HlyD family secretion protein
MAAKRKWKWKWALAVLVLAAAVVGYRFFYKGNQAAAAADPAGALRTGMIIRGDISSMVTGSGSVATSREQSLAAPGASTLLEIHVEDGATVSKGDLLFILDCPEVESSQQSLSQYQYRLEEYYAAREELQRRADRDYLVTSVEVKTGDKLTKNGALFSLLDVSTMTLQVPAGEGAAWAEGQKIQVALLEYGNTLSGTLAGPATITGSNGMEYMTFILQLDKGQRIAGETYGQAYNQDSGGQAVVMLKPNAESILRAPADGYLDALNVTEGEVVNTGALMYRISSTSLESQISEANSEMQVAMAQLKQKKTTLTADFDGIYYAAADSSGPKNTFLQAGDSLTANESLGKVIDSDRMQLVFNVDELDIAQVALGQEVRVVADALPDKTYTGRVARISQEGSGSGNVAYYWVLIEVTDWEGLKVGMTTSLEIVVAQSENTLLAPINAVHTSRGVKYVILAEDQSNTGGAGPGAGTAVNGERPTGGQSGAKPDSAEQSAAEPGSLGQDATGSSGAARPSNDNAGTSAPAGQGSAAPGRSAALQLPERAVIVETGIISDAYVEILSGLEEGQIVEITGTAAADSSEQGFMMGFGGFGGAGNGSGPVTGAAPRTGGGNMP